MAVSNRIPLISTSLLLVSVYSVGVEPVTEPETSQPPPASEEQSAQSIESYTPDETISEDNAIALPSDI